MSTSIKDFVVLFPISIIAMLIAGAIQLPILLKSKSTAVRLIPAYVVSALGVVMALLLMFGLYPVFGDAYAKAAPLIIVRLSSVLVAGPIFGIGGAWLVYLIIRHNRNAAVSGPETEKEA